ncbi:MAG: hypothetical protein O7H41_09400 [Planctomycetota bacterium]|nr:hypothetical protein [Planctomycetota bacterium]
MIENGFEVAVGVDAAAEAKVLGIDFDKSEVTNYRFIGYAGLTIDETGRAVGAAM